MADKRTRMAEAIEAYEDALIRGLCRVGAFEVARGFMQVTMPGFSIHDLDRAMKATHSKGAINIKRIYDAPSPDDGTRVLVDRLWPRGVAKKSAHVDEWLKEIAPSNELRKWFGHDPARWPEFQRRYKHELASQADAIDGLRVLSKKGTLTLLYAAKDEAHNNAVVLQSYLKRRGAKKRAAPARRKRAASS
jgi:uncharacterized protein YeaO (DUF488 family)